MTKSIKNFEIYNMIYNQEKQNLSFEFNVDDRKIKCNCKGAITVTDILRAVEEVVEMYYITESE